MSKKKHRQACELATTLWRPFRHRVRLSVRSQERNIFGEVESSDSSSLEGSDFWEDVERAKKFKSNCDHAGEGVTLMLNKELEELDSLAKELDDEPLGDELTARINWKSSWMMRCQRTTLSMPNRPDAKRFTTTLHTFEPGEVIDLDPL